jgi:hypothetical protein
MVSESGDYIGGGASRMWRPGTGSISVSGSTADTVNVGVSGGASGDSFTFTFAAAPGEDLTVGTYENAERTPFRTAGHPGIDIYGDGRGCNKTSGRFTVLDVTPDLSRLWIVYEQHCEGGETALFGEIRFRQPGGDSDLLVAPGRIAWPDEYPDVSGRIVPVTLVNTGQSPVTVSGTDISGDAADFSVAGNSCTTLAVSAECTIYVAFRPTASGSRSGILTIEDDTAAGVHTVTLTGRGIAGRTSWTMHSEQGDWIGQGVDYSYTPQNATITASGNESFAYFSVRSGDDWWSADFEADSGHLLLPGTTFTNATRYPFNATSSPGMDISGNGRGCNELTGTFTVDHAVYEGGRLKEFAIRFEQHCKGGTGALFGSIEWRVGAGTTPPSPPDTAPPAPVTNVQAYPLIGSAVLGWDDPLDTDWSDTVVRGSVGQVAPASVNDGQLVYRGRDGGVLMNGLAPGTDYSLSIFPRDMDGNVGEATSLTLRGSEVSLSAKPTRVRYGAETALAGVLVDARSGKGLVDAPLAIYRRWQGDTSWRYLTTIQTGADGTYALRRKPSANADYKVSFFGANHHLGATAGPIAVKVAPEISVSANRSTGRVGTTFQLSTWVSPNHTGHNVALQRLHSGTWHNVAQLTLSSTSTASFQVRPAKAGDYRYRIWKPADHDHAASVSLPITLHVEG